MIGRRYIRTAKAKHIIAIMAFVLFWQFSFPQPVAAASIEVPLATDQSQNNDTISAPAESARLPQNPDKPRPEAKRIMRISVTAYSSTPDQTSGDPFITASGTRVHDGTIAANFLPIGTKVRFPDYFGDKIFIVEDRMAARYWHKADIWMTSREAALQWGVRYTTIEIL